MDWQALWLTLKLAVCTTAILFAVGLPIAWGLAGSRGRVARLIETLLTLPMILPPTVIGLYLLMALGPRADWTGF